jgi:hypothetical protein
LERLARILREELPDGSFEYRTKLVEGETAFLEWKVGAPRHPVAQGGLDEAGRRTQRLLVLGDGGYWRAWATR